MYSNRMAWVMGLGAGFVAGPVHAFEAKWVGADAGASHFLAEFADSSSFGLLMACIAGVGVASFCATVLTWR